MIDLVKSAKQVLTLDVHGAWAREVEKLLPLLGNANGVTVCSLFQIGKYNNGEHVTLEWDEIPQVYTEETTGSEIDFWGDIFDAYEEMMNGTYIFSGQRPWEEELYPALRALKDKGLITFPDSGDIDIDIWW